MERIHNRMPVILDSEARDVWLDPKNQDEQTLMGVLKPYSADEMETYPVSKVVNSPENDRPECLNPIWSEQNGRANNWDGYLNDL